MGSNLAVKLEEFQSNSFNEILVGNSNKNTNRIIFCFNEHRLKTDCKVKFHVTIRIYWLNQIEFVRTARISKMNNI